MNVLILGKEKATMERVLPLFEAEGFQPAGVLSESEAREQLKSGNFPAIVTGGAIQGASLERLRALANQAGIAFFAVNRSDQELGAYLTEKIFPSLKNFERDRQNKTAS